jgi:hypothetical protein
MAPGVGLGGMGGLDVIGDINHQKRLFANARPDADFRYRSNAKARFSSLNAM